MGERRIFGCHNNRRLGAGLRSQQLRLRHLELPGYDFRAQQSITEFLICLEEVTDERA